MLQTEESLNHIQSFTSSFQMLSRALCQMERFLNPGLPGYCYYCASTCKKRKTEKTPLGVHICFLFSVQLIAAVCPFMSNHQCMYPHIPTAGSLSQRVAVCFGATSKARLSLPGTFSKFKLISRCALLYKKNPLSLFLSRSLSSCVRFLSRSVSRFLCCYRLSLSHTDYQEATTLLMMMSSLLVLLVEAE